MNSTNEKQKTFAAERARFARLSVPQLIELLSSDDLRTRFLAEMCLRDVTNT
ncbi:MAG TPA: hypothetical protein VEZ40_15320 [Pyrinomonadaceae bacterium]|nr:hypothetical protein [Pyrinomonadaceae bacterium]